MNSIGLSGNYSDIDRLDASIKSIFYNNKSITVYVMNYDIPHEWFINLNQYVNQFGGKVIDKKIDEEQLKQINLNPNNSIKNSKFYFEQYNELDKILYLDSNMIVDTNLDKLFQKNISDKAFYAVRDFENPEDFNPNLLLINLKRWRREKINDVIRSSANGEDETNLINKLFSNQIGELDLAYNYQVGYEREAYWNNWGSVYDFFDLVEKPKIINYITKDKPFNITITTDLRNKWWFYHNLSLGEIVHKHTIFDREKIGELNFDGEIFLFTPVAEIQNLEPLIKKLPDFRFNIAAYTPMAFALTRLSQYDNVRLYPSLTAKKLVEFINNSNIYLDINYGPKDQYILQRIMHRNIPIFTFTATQTHDLNYANYHIFDNEAIDQMAISIKDALKNENLSNDPFYKIDVANIEDTLDEILKQNKSVIRFGDGELALIMGRSITYQDYNEELGKRLKDILLKGSSNTMEVCLPDVFESLESYNQYAQDFYETNVFANSQAILREIEQTDNHYGSTFISRPYIDLRDKSKSKSYFDKLKRLWQHQDILIVEGNLSRSGVGNDLFANANSIKRIICPADNAYAKINDIETAIKQYAENRLVLLMLGPTAKVIIDDLKELPNQLIDIGHIDSEYEWFKMGAKYKVRLKNKHTAEFNQAGDNAQVLDLKDPTYNKEILTKIK